MSLRRLAAWLTTAGAIGDDWLPEDRDEGAVLLLFTAWMIAKAFGVL